MTGVMTNGNAIQGNRIGTDIPGTAPVAIRAGIWIGSLVAANSNIIGGGDRPAAKQRSPTTRALGLPFTPTQVAS